MSRHNAAPTHGWIIASTIFKWTSLFFIILAVILALMTIREVGILDSKCVDDRQFGVGKYTLYITATNTECRDGRD